MGRRAELLQRRVDGSHRRAEIDRGGAARAAHRKLITCRRENDKDPLLHHQVGLDRFDAAVSFDGAVLPRTADLSRPDANRPIGPCDRTTALLRLAYRRCVQAMGGKSPQDQEGLAKISMRWPRNLIAEQTPATTGPRSRINLICCPSICPAPPSLRSPRQSGGALWEMVF